MEISFQRTIYATRSLIRCGSSDLIHRHQSQTHNSIICARKGRSRSRSHRSTLTALKSIAFAASNLGILPEPLNLIIREFGGGGNGGGVGFLRGFGGGGFEGWRRRKRWNLGVLVLVMMGCGPAIWVMLGKELDTDAFLGFLGFGLLGVSIIGWKSGIKDWVLGFCCCAVLFVLGLRREEVVLSWVKGFRGCFPDFLTARRRRGRRRAF